MINIIKWHIDAGGFHGRLAAHALRLLGEVIELCIALGATLKEIEDVFNRETVKACERNEFHAPASKGKIRGEFADVSFLFRLLTGYSNINIEEAEKIKFPIILHRKWEPDIDGVLWRPGHDPKTITEKSEAHKNAKYGKAIE